MPGSFAAKVLENIGEKPDAMLVCNQQIKIRLKLAAKIRLEFLNFLKPAFETSIKHRCVTHLYCKSLFSFSKQVRISKKDKLRSYYHLLLSTFIISIICFDTVSQCII